MKLSVQIVFVLEALQESSAVEFLYERSGAAKLFRLDVAEGRVSCLLVEEYSRRSPSLFLRSKCALVLCLCSGAPVTCRCAHPVPDHAHVDVAAADLVPEPLVDFVLCAFAAHVGRERGHIGFLSATALPQQRLNLDTHRLAQPATDLDCEKPLSTQVPRARHEDANRLIDRSAAHRTTTLQREVGPIIAAPSRLG